MCCPEQNVVGLHSHQGVIAHNGAHQPFPPPLPRASPEQLLQEIRQGLPGYALSRLVAFEATQRVLTKHLREMSEIDVRMGLLSYGKGRNAENVPYRSSSAYPVVHGKPKF